MTLSRPGAPGTSGPLIGIGLGDGVDLEGVHADAGVVDLEFAVAGVHDVHDTVHGEGGLGNVGGDDAFAGSVGGFHEDFRLEITGELGVDGQYGQGRGFFDLFQTLLDQIASHLKNKQDFISFHDDISITINFTVNINQSIKRSNSQSINRSSNQTIEQSINQSSNTTIIQSFDRSIDRSITE